MSVRTLLQLCMVVVLACSASACGSRGKLKSPTQMVAAQSKKEHKQAKADKKKAKEAAQDAQDDAPQDDADSPSESPQAPEKQETK